jgi:hypothetical protein
MYASDNNSKLPPDLELEEQAFRGKCRFASRHPAWMEQKELSVCP